MAFKTVFIVTIISTILFVCVSAVEINTKNAWKNFKTFYKKSYDPQEEDYRFKVFEGNVLRIVKHNLEADLHAHSFYQKANHFADLTSDEFNRNFNNLQVDIDTFDPLMTYDSCSTKVVTPDSLDYRKLGMVSPVGNQLNCDSAYVFAALGALEAAWKNATGKLVPLSTKNVLDCLEPEDGITCKGGSIVDVYRYVMENKGINTEKAYPYSPEVKFCNFKKDSAVAAISGFKKVMTGTEQELKEALVAFGPIAVGINAKPKSFQHYSNGIYHEKCCDGKANHAMLCVGYGQEDGEKYWLLKNSWSEKWGENGYMRLARDKDNACSIATHAIFPIIQKS